MENGVFALKSKCSIFHNIFKYIGLQRHQKALLWSKGLTPFPAFKTIVICSLFCLGTLVAYTSNNMNPDQ